MNQQSDWSVATVQDFFEHCNWLGPMQRPSLDANPTVLSDNWQCQTVATFFQNHNWSGRKRQQYGWQDDNRRSPSLMDSVGHYFDALPWQGHPSIGHLPLVKAMSGSPSMDHDLSISDLSNLF